MRIFVLTATYELRVSRKSLLRDHPMPKAGAARKICAMATGGLVCGAGLVRKRQEIRRSLECNVNRPKFMQQYCIYMLKKRQQHRSRNTSLISTISKEGSVAEWSKALVLGTSPQGRGFESHRCQIFSSRRD
jgi:hypothetical protein